MINSIDFPNANNWLNPIIYEGKIDLLKEQLFVSLLEGDGPVKTGGIELAGYVVRTMPLVNPHVIDGAFNADDVTFRDVVPGRAISSVLIHTKNWTSVAVIRSMTGLYGLHTNGGDIAIQWDEAPSYIFKV